MRWLPLAAKETKWGGKTEDGSFGVSDTRPKARLLWDMPAPGSEVGEFL